VIVYIVILRPLKFIRTCMHERHKHAHYSDAILQSQYYTEYTKRQQTVISLLFKQLADLAWMKRDKER